MTTPNPFRLLLHHSTRKVQDSRLEEAQRCLPAGAFTASVVMSGRGIEAMCQHFKTKNTSLFGGLKELHDKQIIDARPYEWGDELRKHRNLARVGDALDVSFPRGSFILQVGQRPVVLLSAGIGATPVLAMLHALAAARSARQVLWLHAARDREHHPFAAEVRRLMLAFPQGRSYVCYSKPASFDKLGEDFDAAGHLSRSVLEEVGIPREAGVYLCGPAAFMTDMKAALAGYGIPPERIHVAIFNGSEPMSPGVVGAVRRNPHPPEGDTNTGSLVSSARSGIAAHWNASVYQSILELAEACDVPVRWACRSGVCHSCESGLVSGAVAYGPEPLDKPAEGNILVCCSQPIRDVVIDL
jgi:ferredoxin-NADP reductase/ferredoxin